MDKNARMIRLFESGHYVLPLQRNAGLSDALGGVGTESTPGGHRRSPNPRSGTGSRKSDGTDNKGGPKGVDKKARRFISPLCGRESDFNILAEFFAKAKC